LPCWCSGSGPALAAAGEHCSRSHVTPHCTRRFALGGLAQLLGQRQPLLTRLQLKKSGQLRIELTSQQGGREEAL
jgi:hypothetical protein